MSIGQIVQVIGAVVDIEFARDAMPKVYEALVLEKDESNPLAEEGLTFEVQQQLGDGVVRTIAMGSSEGLQRGMKVKSTGHEISVPVGPKTLGRIMDVLGRPIDDCGDIGAEEVRPIHRPARSSTNSPRPLNFSKPALRLLTLSARSPRAARSASSAVPVWARPST